MFKLLIVLNFFTGLWARFNYISEVNELKNRAEEAGRSGKYAEAGQLYSQLIQTYGVNEPQVLLNYAHSQYYLQNYPLATQHYKTLSHTANVFIRSQAFLGLGLIHAHQDKEAMALDYFKSAMMANPDLEEARYNYELILENAKHKTSGNESGGGRSNTSNTNQQGQTQEKQENSEPQKGQRENSTKEKPDPESLEPDKEGVKSTDALVAMRMQEIKMSRWRAKLILDALKNQEVQYIQQQTRKIVKPDQMPEW